jgi:hypothetical protein
VAAAGSRRRLIRSHADEPAVPGNDAVTAWEETDHMFQQREQATGVCLVRVQRQAASLLITVIETPDISGRCGETTTSFSDVDSAVDAVKEFIVRFTMPRSNGFGR